MPRGQLEELRLDKVIKRQRYIVGRATIYQKAYYNSNKSSSPLIIKDSQEGKERPEEGLLLKKEIKVGVENIAKYYYYKTIYNRPVEGKANNKTLGILY